MPLWLISSGYLHVACADRRRQYVSTLSAGNECVITFYCISVFCFSFMPYLVSVFFISQSWSERGLTELGWQLMCVCVCVLVGAGRQVNWRPGAAVKPRGQHVLSSWDTPGTAEPRGRLLPGGWRDSGREAGKIGSEMWQLTSVVCTAAWVRDVKP